MSVQSSRQSFRRKTKNRNKIKATGSGTVLSGGVRMQEADAVHQPGVGLPGGENSAPTVIYNSTVSVS